MPRAPRPGIAKTKPVIPINWEEVDRLLEIGCTGTEIAARFGMHEDTLYNRTVLEKRMGFSAYAAQKRANGDALLREMQFKSAKRGSVPMQIWLGKNRLDQKDSPTEVSVSPETVSQFNQYMEQLKKVQESLRMEETKAIKEKRS